MTFYHYFQSKTDALNNYLHEIIESYLEECSRSNFIVQHLNSDSKFRAFCAEQKKGGTRTRLYYKTLCEFSVMVPKSAEQNKISSLLLGIDHLITLHQRKLERLQNIKKSCLEKMFV